MSFQLRPKPLESIRAGLAQRGGAGRPKGSFGRKRLHEMMATYKARVEQGQLEFADMHVRDLSTAMLDAAVEVDKHEDVWRPAFLKRQSNRGVRRAEALRKLAKHRSQLEKAAEPGTWRRSRGTGRRTDVFGSACMPSLKLSPSSTRIYERESRARKKDIDKTQDLRRERCRISKEKHAAGDQTRPEKYRDINMHYFEGEGDDRKFSTYYKFEYGKNKEGYWTGEKMIEHMADVLDLLAVKFPNYKPICFFDWSSCHDCVEEGAPSVSRMNAGESTHSMSQTPPIT
ncbi:unnamed protein product [Ectocarpus sp. CCAP 1310/34]|nr:unnamed protein product [Ectocarpus sp. CCAP 1310/34]